MFASRLPANITNNEKMAKKTLVRVPPTKPLTTGVFKNVATSTLHLPHVTHSKIVLGYVRLHLGRVIYGGSRTENDGCSRGNQRFEQMLEVMKSRRS